jgi:hypothetical protein
MRIECLGKYLGLRGGNYMRNFVICSPHPMCASDQIKKNYLGGECSMYGGEERCIQGFGGET